MPARVRRTDDDWMQLITECRQSGVADKLWCEQHDIPISSFYNAVVRLRKKACDIPTTAARTPVIDLTTSKQDVVRIGLVPDEPVIHGIPSAPEQNRYISHIDNSHMIEASFSNRRSIYSDNHWWTMWTCPASESSIMQLVQNNEQHWKIYPVLFFHS